MCGFRSLPALLSCSFLFASFLSVNTRFVSLGSFPFLAFPGRSAGQPQVKQPSAAWVLYDLVLPGSHALARIQLVARKHFHCGLLAVHRTARLPFGGRPPKGKGLCKPCMPTHSAKPATNKLRSDAPFLLFPFCSFPLLSRHFLSFPFLFCPFLPFPCRSFFRSLPSLSFPFLLCPLLSCFVASFPLPFVSFLSIPFRSFSLGEKEQVPNKTVK